MHTESALSRNKSPNTYLMMNTEVNHWSVEHTIFLTSTVFAEDSASN